MKDEKKIKFVYDIDKLMNSLDAKIEKPKPITIVAKWHRWLRRNNENTSA